MEDLVKINLKLKQGKEKLRKLKISTNADRRRFEDSVKFALGGMLLKIVNEGSGAVSLTIDGKTFNVEDMISLLKEAQQEPARKMLNRENPF